MKNLSRKLVLSFLAAGTLAATSVSHASGFAIIEQSVSGLGNAFAGGAASAEDATTVFFNPAGMTRVGNSQVVGALHYIQPSIEFSKTEALDAGYPVATNITGGDGGDAGTPAVVPNVYFTTSLNEVVTVGLGINAPFGLSTEYDKDWVGRYYGVESGVKTININPAVAFKVSEAFSVGAGISYQQLDAVLSRSINAKALCGYLFGLGLPGAGACTVAGTPAQDIYGEITGTSSAWGANYGIMYEFTPKTRLGFHYRSTIRHHVTGDADFSDVDAYLQGAEVTGALGDGFFYNTDAKTDITLPASASLSYNQSFGDNFQIMADATWTQWSVMDEVRIEYSRGSQGDTVEEFGWSNAMRYSFGATFKPVSILSLRAGLAYDESPVHSKRKRGVRLPDNDRTWIALGAGLDVARGVQLDVGFAHLMIDDAEIHKDEGGLEGTLVGDYKLSTNIFSAQAAWSF